MTNPVLRWQEEHGRFMRLLDKLEAQLDRFHSGQRPDYAFMLDVMRYMRRYVDRIHHPREDLAFAKVAAREAACRPLVDALIGEHDEITRSGETLVVLLEAVLDDAIVERAQVEEPGRAYARRLRDHMRREEMLFPAVTRWMHPRDWAQIERAVPLRPDPLVVAAPGDAFEALRRAA